MPLSVPRYEPKFERDKFDSEVSTPPPILWSQETTIDPLSGLSSLSEFHRYATTKQAVIPPMESRCFVPSEVCTPSASFNRKEPPNSGVSHFAGYVASSGFLYLSTLCSLRDLPGLFHPGTAHGVFYPSRPLSSPGAVHPLGCPRPSRFRLYQSKEETSQGTTTPSKARPRDWGLDRIPLSVASLGFYCSEVSCPWQWLALTRPLFPHVLLRFNRRLTSPPAPQGISLPKTQPVSLEIGEPPCSFSPRCASRRFGDLAGLGVWVSLGYRRALPRALVSSSPCCQIPGRSLPRSPCR